ncbi:MAG TPA: glucose-6-phosphate dehydrogenase [Candidatus Izemoplasmatales bacterium]|nr:glucose-6-phosphate dehydrogenase [Candidatus Izemoplasmatales bacterium]
MKKALVIFGSTGNLMYKKLIPAIYHLYQKNHIDQDFKIYAITRHDETLETYIEHAKENVSTYIDWNLIEGMMVYVHFDVHNIDDYRQLKNRIHADGYEDISLYLAVPPKLFPVIAKGVSQSKLIQKNEPNKRIVFEKPFGEDLKSAQDINRELWQCFNESQIYRIDHYLGKEMIQNIMVVRFSNIVFEQSWNQKAVRSITILSKEEEGIMSRGGYYDKIGASKDMLQSHLLQMVALVLMDTPKDFSSESIKDEKVKVFKSLVFNQENLIFGQYKGYKGAEKVEKTSNTETFVYAKAFMNNQRWKNVPIHFLTGKKLNEKRSEIIIHFKDGHDLGGFFPKKNKQENKLIIKVSPQEGVEFKFSVKEPGLTNNIQPAILDYCHNCKSMENSPEAYERLLLELIQNQRTLFTRWDEIEETWQLIAKIKSDKPPIIYKNYQDLIERIDDKDVDKDDL